MTDGDDIEMLAAEYVLGTLDGAERVAVSARRLREPALDRAITDWENRLAPLAAAVAPVAPPAGLLERMAPRLGGDRGTAEAGAVVALRRSVRRWRAASAAAMALAASLLVVIGVREVSRVPQGRFVAVFHKDDETPSFVMAIDIDNREVTVRPVAAPRQPERTYQLWIAAEPLGGRPRSLGLISDATYTTTKIGLPIDRAALQTATFGVSVEPPGGSPTGVPTGPALHAKLIRVAP